ncbi:unnamed protein product [Blepharisma stoltei]|uniref:Uncharacterized protein n=1 Tax=Blepharisma stoltei TaxID=1481888 RepID=A0AAU9JL80_9CILI|nr:unnamed protein product [Blepharisma stoltei]
MTSAKSSSLQCFRGDLDSASSLPAASSDSLSVFSAAIRSIVRLEVPKIVASSSFLKETYVNDPLDYALSIIPFS